MSKIVLATGNKGKVKELAQLLSDQAIEIVPQSDFNVPDVPETGTTFVENAIIKARHAAKITGLPAIADDSGLEVDALQGAPGVYSARYAAEVYEFDKVGLSADFVAGIEAPFVAQSQLKFSLELREVMPLAINGTILVIGEITHIMVDESGLKDDGYIDIEALESVAVSGLDSYHQTQRLARLSYAKPDKALVTLPIDGH